VLFDLRGKRRRVVQVVFAMLALLFLDGFLGFGIGVGGGPGGIFDALGISNNSSSGSSTAVFQDKIDKANTELAKNPKDAHALLTVASNEYLIGKSGVSQDPSTGQISVTNDGHTHLGNAADAWSKYLKANKGKPDTAVAAEMVTAYIVLNDAQGAISSQRIIAEDQPSFNSYGTLAQFEYLTGKVSAGDADAKKALSEASKSQRKSAKTQLDQLRKQGLKVQKQQKQAQKQSGGTATTPGSNPLQNPFSGLGATPTTTP
jgi:hypothetical protein